jgi:CRISPR-associated protein Cas8b/Csh1 subtype I-B
MGMRWIRQGFAARGRADEGLVADLTRTLFFFEAVAGPSSKMGEASMGAAIYGDSPQADRVRAFFEQAAGLLRSDAAAQAAFLLGACCKRIMDIQDRIRGARPFFGKLKGLRVSEGDLKRLLPEAVGKSEAYGEDNRRIVAPLLECAGAAMAAAGDGWKLSADEISYYFALGLVLASRLAAKDASAAGGAGA